MPLFKYDADNISDIYNNIPIESIFRFKLIGFEGNFDNFATQIFYQDNIKCTYTFYENLDLKFIPRQNIKKYINGNVLDGEEIEPYYVLKANSTVIFETGVTLLDLQGQMFIKIYPLPTNEQNGYVGLMFGGSHLLEPGKVRLMIHNFGRTDQRMEIGENLAMMV